MNIVDGILIIDKPAGPTSHDVVGRVRRLLGTKRVGHTGTLDPFATGVLVVLVGKATRLARFLDKDRKEYIADVQFGARTDTGDRTGTPISDRRLRSEGLSSLLKNVDWNEVLRHFTGPIVQTPPMYSAKKVGGKKLYELAREGKEAERKAIAVTVHKLAIVDDSELIEHSRLRLRVECSAGTYVRTLAEDIGEYIGAGAHLAELRRTAAGKFDIGQSLTLEELESSPLRENVLLPIDRAVSHLAEFNLTDERIEKTKSGLSTRVDDDGFADGQYVRMTERGGNVIAVGVYDEAEKSIRPKVVLI